MEENEKNISEEEIDIEDEKKGEIIQIIDVTDSNTPLLIEDNVCIICQVNKPNMTLNCHINHKICKNCSSRLVNSTCPFCRQRITGWTTESSSSSDSVNNQEEIFANISEVNETMKVILDDFSGDNILQDFHDNLPNFLRNLEYFEDFPEFNYPLFFHLKQLVKK
jgi:hypothetical protein